MSRISGGQIDRSKTLRFSFDGVSYTGHPGDTLASALLANNVRLMGRSFKYHRPRGVISAGSEEPNAIVELRSGARQEPNTRATVIELFDGLQAQSQNRWPSLKFDAMAINDRLSPFFAAGFYYKTFMWPAAFWEKIYEPIIRRAAGLGSLSKQDDPDTYDKGFLHCDLLIIGAGPAGLSAALTAGRAGARVILADEDFRMGGRLNAETLEIGGTSGADWAAKTVLELSTLPNVRLMPRTTVMGAFDHGIYGAVERVSDHLAEPLPGKPRQTLWRIYTKRTILAAGATERPIAFENNDRPGIMLASALRAYANRWGVAVGEKVAVFTNNDDGLRTVADLKAKGLDVTLIDARKGDEVIDSAGRLGLKSITIRRANGQTETLHVTALGVSGGWNPNLNIASNHRGRPIWDDQIAAFIPAPESIAGLTCAGAAAGAMSTHAALTTGANHAIAALADLGLTAIADIPQAEDAPLNLTPAWYVHSG
ncbi:2Fe-2S iron-sulfur cluster-binding protein, partial [Cypionkella sp.]|uniref:2Fe-2S iron-sulfur cluster-binding protein n=1 Tax=Cypionkella sp. TaxID=2811411 RepID=UPI0026070C17